MFLFCVSFCGCIMDNTFLLNFYFKAIVQSERQDDFLASMLRCCVRTIDTLCRSVNVCLGATQSKPGKLRETILFFPMVVASEDSYSCLPSIIRLPACATRPITDWHRLRLNFCCWNACSSNILLFNAVITGGRWVAGGGGRADG